MRLSVQEATELGERTLSRYGMRAEYARMVAEHLVDAALCGDEFASLPRMLAIVEELKTKPPPGEVRIVRENACSALIDGGDNIAYAVSVIAIDKAIEICRENGVAVVGVNNTWFSGRLGYYVERAARQGFIAVHTTNTTARVAPFGGIDRLFGTNPFAIAFPAADASLVIDFSTAAATWGEVILHKNKGEPLPPGVAVDKDGRPTTDPQAALEGAFLNWGGHRGYGLCLAIQALAVLAGSPPVVQESGKFGLFFLVLDPELLMPGGGFGSRISELKELVRSSRPAGGVARVRIPGENTMRRRETASATGLIHVNDQIYARICELSL